MTRPLSLELISEYERTLKDHGFPGFDALLPGVDPDLAQEAFDPLGITLSDEARLWWSWQNGDGSDRSEIGTYMGVDMTILPVEEAVKDTAFNRTLNGGVDEPDIWLESWVVIAAGTQQLVIECSTDGSRRPTSPAFLVGFDRLPEEVTRVDSMGGLLEVCIEAVKRGAWAYEPAGWVLRPERVTPYLDKSGLIT